MKKNSGGFLPGFREFIMRGNVMDLAIGIIIGSAFTAIVSSLVNDLIMPCMGLIVGKISLSDLKYVITPATETTAEAAIRYGAFLQSIVNFLLIALVIFAIVRVIGRLRRRGEAPEPEQAAPASSAEVQLLSEIRDLLKKEAAIDPGAPKNV